MKNRFLFVFMLLLFSMGAAVAQTPAKHWTLSGHPAAWDPLNMTATMVVQINGEESVNPNLELAAFIEDVLMTDGTFPILGGSGRYLYYMTLNGYDPSKPNAIIGGNKLHFKLYDHDAETVLDYTCPVEVIYSTNWNLGSTDYPMAVSFYSDPVWEQVTDAASLTNGDVILVTNTETTYAMSGEQLDNNRGSYAVTLADGTITWEPGVPYEVEQEYYDEDEEEWYTETVTVIPFEPQEILLYAKPVDDDNPNTLMMFVGNGYLYPGSSSQSRLYTGNDIDDNYYWNFSFDDSGEANVAGQGSNTRNIMRFIANTQKFSCYPNTTSQLPIYVYKMVGGSNPLPETYTLEVNAEPAEGGTAEIQDPQETYVSGASVTVVATAANGWTFVGWFEAQELVSENEEYTFEIDHNSVLYAQFEEEQEDEFMVTIEVSPSDEAGQVTGFESGETTPAGPITLTAIANTGWDFVNWTVDGQEVGTEAEEFNYEVTEEVTIVANFELHSYEVNTDVDPSQDAATLTVNADNTYLGTTITVTYEAADGWDFDHWTVNGEDAGEEEVLSVEITDDMTIVAYFILHNYEINVVANPAEGGEAGFEGETTLGSMVTLWASEAEHWDFVNWTLNDEEVGTENNYTFEVNGDAEYVANFEQHSYEVNTDVDPSQDAGTVTVNADNTYYGTTITVTAEAAEGWDFDYWTVNGQEAGEEEEISVEITGDMTIVAYFILHNYEINVVANPAEGGEAGFEGETTLGSMVTLWASEAEHWDFVNWTLNDEEVGTENNYTFEVNGNAEYVANFEQHSYEVNTDVDPTQDAGTVTVNAENTYYGTTITVTAEAANGWKFNYWTVNGQEAGEDEELSVEISGDMEIVAYFEQEVYHVTVIVNPEGAGEVEFEDIDYYYGDEVTVEVTEVNENYQFQNFTVEGIGQIDFPYMITGDLTITANFIEATVTLYNIEVNAVPEEGGSVTGGGTFQAGESTTLEATANTGYHFVNWTVDGEEVSDQPTYEVEDISDNMSFDGNFALDDYDVILNFDETMGTAAITAGEADVYHYGDEVTIEATPGEGYRFLQWLANQDVVTDNPYTFTVTETITFDAIFEVIPAETYTLSVSAEPAEGGNAEINEPQENYEAGTNVTVVAEANEGWEFAGWYENEELIEGAEETYTFAIDHNTELVAHFTEIVPVYQVILNFDETMGTAAITEGEAEEYHYGDVVTIEATPGEGYRFLQWLANQDVVTDNPYTFTVTETITFDAIFEVIPAETYTLSVSAEPAEGGNAEINEPQENYEAGTEVTVVASANDHWVFAGWYENEELIEGAEETYTFAIDHNTELVAQFTEEELDLDIQLNIVNGGNVIVEPAGPYHYNDTITITAVANDDYEFDYFVVQEAKEEIRVNPYGFRIKKSMTIEVFFKEKTVEYEVKVNVNPAEAGTVEGAGTFPAGTEMSLQANPNEGWAFVNWTGEGLDEPVTDNPYTFSLDGDVTLTANFEAVIMTYTVDVTLDPTTAGSVEGLLDSYEEGDEVSLNAVANPGFTFLYWTIEGDETEYPNPLVIEHITSDLNVTAHFEAGEMPDDMFDVMAYPNPNNGGVIEGNGQYANGATATLKAIPNPGFTFKRWKLGGWTYEYSNPYVFTVTGDVDILAEFDHIQSNVVVNVVPEGAGVIDGAGLINQGETCMLTANENPGFEFANWVIPGFDEPVEDNPCTFTVNNNMTVTANFNYKEYTIDVTVAEGDGAIEANPDQATYHYGDEVVLTAAPAEGYHLVSWTVDGETVEGETTTVVINDNVEVVVNFAINTYDVTVVAEPAEGGEVTGTGNYAHGTPIEPTATPAEGYTFIGWTVDGTPIELPYTVTGEVTIVANFQINTYDVTVIAEPAEGGEVTGTGNYAHGTPIEPTATAAEGYTFIGWTVDGNPVELPYTVTGEVTIVANFQINSYDVTVVAEPAEGGEVTGTGNYTYGTQIEPTATPAEGYTFTGWTVDGNPIELPYTVTGEVTIVANFQVNTYDVTVIAEPAEGGEVTGTGNYAHGTQIEPTATPAEGYTFTGWTVDGNPIELPYTVTGEVTIVANFQINSYDVTVIAEPAEGGEVTGTGNYPHGTPIEPTATPAEGYTFTGWTVDGNPIELPYTVTGEVTIVANFQINTYDVTVVANPTEGGEVTGTGNYPHGTPIEPTATPAEGYTFTGWTVDGNPIELPYTVIGEVTIVANFLINSYVVNVSANPAEGGEVSVEGALTHGATVTVHAVEATGYHFINWTENGSQVSANADYSFELTEDRDLVANFSINSYVITAEADPEAGGMVSGYGGYEYNDLCELTAEENEGYTFINWMKDGEEVSDQLSFSFNVTETAHYVAHFQLNNYHITVIANDDTYGAVDGEGDYDHFSTAHLTANAFYGYHFVNWTKDGVVYSTDAAIDVEVTGPATYEAIFEVTYYEIAATAEPAEGGQVEGADTYAEGEWVTLVATENEHYHFVNWTEDGVEVSSEATYEFEATADRTLVANFEAVMFNVMASVVPNYYGTIEGEGMTFDGLSAYGNFLEGTEVTLTAVPNEGYEFLYWKLETGFDTVYTATYTFEIDRERNILAFFQQIPGVTYYQIDATANPEEGGTIEGAGEYAEGANVTLTAEANEGYRFLNWTEDGEVISEEEEISFTAEADRTLVANFELIPIEYTITVEEVEHAEITAPATSIAGEIITVNVLLEPMYRLVNLYYYTDDPENTTAINLQTLQFVMPEADVTIGAELLMVTGIGDVNLDGEVNILDVLATVNYVLGDDVQPFDFEQADMNEDGIIDISDALAINALILGLRADCGDANVTFEVVNGKLMIESEYALAGYQFALTAEPASIDMPGFTTVGKWNNGEYILLVFNLNGEKEAGIYSVLEMGDAELNDIVMATREGCRVRGIAGTVSVASFDEAAYSVFPVPANSYVTVAGPEITTIDVYNMMGQKVMTVNAYSDETVVNVSTLSVGSYLFRINTANGATTKNVVVVR